MSLEDRLLIQEVIAKYSYSYDGRDADGFAQLFVEDAIFEVIVPTQSRPAVRLLSRAAIRKWAVRRHELTAGTQARHYQSGLLFDELTVNTARTRTMLLLIRQGAPDSAPLPQLTGVYHDTWRKTGEGWQLVHRAAHLDRDPGFGSAEAGSDAMRATDLCYMDARELATKVRTAPLVASLAELDGIGLARELARCLFEDGP